MVVLRVVVNSFRRPIRSWTIDVRRARAPEDRRRPPRCVPYAAVMPASSFSIRSYCLSTSVFDDQSGAVL